MQRRWWVFAAISLAFFFATATTFTSLGVVLFSMAGELHWSQSDAGLSFSLMALACGLASPLPAIGMRRVGARLTVFAGALVLAAGFYLAAGAHSLMLFFLATTLMGAGFTLMAPVPGIYLLPTWFPQRSARMVGFYFMLGALGGIVGPPLVDLALRWSGNWRAHWALMGHASLLLSLICLLLVRDDAAAAQATNTNAAAIEGDAIGISPADSAEFPSSLGRALLSRRFLWVALAMLVIQTGLTVVHGMLVSHVAHLGGTRAYGALAMSLIAIAETTSKGLAGPLAERIHPRHLLITGLALQALAFLELSLGHTPRMTLVFALIYGSGWGLGWIGANVLLLRYYGRRAAPRMVAAAVTITTLAVVGPVAAGAVADHTGSLALVFLGLGLLTAATSLGLLLVRSPDANRLEHPLPPRLDDTQEPAAKFLPVTD